VYIFASFFPGRDDMSIWILVALLLQFPMDWLPGAPTAPTAAAPSVSVSVGGDGVQAMDGPDIQPPKP
jgi:hypothetical protein